MNEQRPASEQSVRDKEPAVFLHAIERRYRQGDATLEILKAAPNLRCGRGSRWR